MTKRAWKIVDDYLILSKGHKISLRPGEAKRLLLAKDVAFDDQMIIAALGILREEFIRNDFEDYDFQ